MHPTWLPRTEALNHWRINLLSALKDKSRLNYNMGPDFYILEPMP